MSGNNLWCRDCRSHHQPVDECSADPKVMERNRKRSKARWDKLRDKFFDECVGRTIDRDEDHLILLPEYMFEWIKDNIK